MIIERLGPEHETAYDEFLLKDHRNLIYPSVRFRNFLTDVTGAEPHGLLALADGEIVGALPLHVSTGKFGKVYNSLPFYGSNGGVITRDPEAARALLAAYTGLVTATGVCAGCVVENPLTGSMVEFPHQITDQRIGQFTPLDDVDDFPEVLMSVIDSSTRRNIRKAIREGVAVREDNGCFDFLREVHLENMASIGGNPKPDRFFQAMRDNFRPGTDYRIYTAELDGERVAALLLLYFNQTVEYYTPVIRHDYRSQQPLALIVYQAMVEAQALGFRRWNWGGTWLSQDGVYRFKKKWNTEDIPYTYYIHVTNDEVFSSNKAELLHEYPLQYVIPFNRLEG